MLLCSETSVIRFYKYHQLPAAVHRAGGQCTVRDISTQQKNETEINCVALFQIICIIHYLQGGEPSAGEPGAMSVTKSVSVSKVSVKMGDVREEGRDLGLGLGPELDPSLYLPIVNPRVTQQPPATFLRYLLDQLQQVAAVNTDLNMNHVANDVHYQLVYKDDTDYYSDYDLDHLSDEYLDYLYQIYDDLDNDLTYYDDDASYVDNDSQVVVALQEEYNDVDTAVHRSEQAQGRALDTEEGVAEQLFENVVAPASTEVTDVAVNKLEYVDKFLNISKQEVKDEATETTIEDFVVELKSTNNSDVYIKIGIFITVSLAVLVMTGNDENIHYSSDVGSFLVSLAQSPLNRLMSRLCRAKSISTQCSCAACH